MNENLEIIKDIVSLSVEVTSKGLAKARVEYILKELKAIEVN